MIPQEQDSLIYNCKSWLTNGLGSICSMKGERLNRVHATLVLPTGTPGPLLPFSPPPPQLFLPNPSSRSSRPVTDSYRHLRPSLTSQASTASHPCLLAFLSSPQTASPLGSLCSVASSTFYTPTMPLFHSLALLTRRPAPRRTPLAVSLTAVSHMPSATSA